MSKMFKFVLCLWLPSLMFLPFANASKDAKTTKTAKKSDEQKVHLKIKGMSCGGCVARITSTLKGIKGVKSAKVTLEDGHAVIVCNPKKVKTAFLVSSVQKLGYTVNTFDPAAKTKATPKAGKKSACKPGCQCASCQKKKKASPKS